MFVRDGTGRTLLSFDAYNMLTSNQEAFAAFYRETGTCIGQQENILRPEFSELKSTVYRLC